MNVLSLCFLCSSACKWRFLHKQFISDLKSRCRIIFRFYFLDDVMMTLSNTQSQTVCAGRRVCKLEKEQTAKSAKHRQTVNLLCDFLLFTPTTSPTSCTFTTFKVAASPKSQKQMASTACWSLHVTCQLRHHRQTYMTLSNSWWT